MHHEADLQISKLIDGFNTAPIAPYRPKTDIVQTARRKLRVREIIQAMHARYAAAAMTRRRGLRRKRIAMALSAGVVGFGAAGMTVPPDQTGESYQADYLRYGSRLHASELSASADLREAMIEEEGVRQRVYRDVAGYLTVGIGHLIRASDKLQLGDRISKEQVLDFFEDDLSRAEAAAARLAGDTPLYQHEFDALVDLVYNVGEGNVSPTKSPRLNAALQGADYDAIAAELHYTTAGGSVAKGLVNRSERRANIFENAEYADPRHTA
ncbi:lysozyme [Croceicoccus naphthovorans]|nr:lysozyme [Croceicoccus naphthovorans]MBB3990434.1 GH24 family phage-related lysozyme (muramidase) [Croceicoccus naphthovorans]